MYVEDFHLFLQQLITVLRGGRAWHPHNYILKTLIPQQKLDLINWRIDTVHGLLHGLITAYWAVLIKNNWILPDIYDNQELERLVASCLVHDYVKVIGHEPHDKKLIEYFSFLNSDTYSHANPDEVTPLVQADRIELLRFADAKDWVNYSLLPMNDKIEFFYKHIRPALDKLFAGRHKIWLRHGYEIKWGSTQEQDIFYPSYYMPMEPNFWNIEVGELPYRNNLAIHEDHYFPAGFMCLDEFNGIIKSAPDREHEMACAKIPLKQWIFILRDNYIPEVPNVLESSGFITIGILKDVIDVADMIYAKLSVLSTNS